MSAVRSLVFRTAGTNCDTEALHALKRAGSEVDLVHLNTLLAEPERLRGYDLLFFPGGFTYGDDIQSGTVFAVEMRRRLLPEIRDRVADGALVLGICNGFQILTRCGLLPGAADGTVQASLQPNASGRFECRWVRLEVTTDRCAFLERGQIIECPVAHAEGRFVTHDGIRSALHESGQIAVRYTAPDGGDADYPWNPNGSRDGIAGVCDSTGRILGMMPHPERNVETWHHPRWTRGELGGAGLAIFTNAINAARASR